MDGTLTSYSPVRRIGVVNWLGVYTLYVKEVQRFLKLAAQTVLSPAVTGLLFLAVFSLAFGRSLETVGDVPYLVFLAPGLVIMAVIQNAFANTSSTLIISKLQGNIIDVLMPPLSPGELVFAFALGGATRGILVAAVAIAAMALFVPFEVHSLAAIVFFVAATALALSLFGLMVGVWADKFDNIAFISNFAITPLAFLSGTFYSVERLPKLWRTISELDPFFYMIDGFRYGFIGHADGSVAVGVAVLVALNAVLWFVCYVMFARGYKLKG